MNCEKKSSCCLIVVLQFANGMVNLLIVFAAHEPRKMGYK